MTTRSDKVYPVQLQMRWNSVTKAMESIYDYGHAESFGNLQEPLVPYPMAADGGDTKPLTELLYKRLHDFTPNDYLILTGSPVVIGAAVAVAAQITGGNVQVLTWDKRLRQYYAQALYV